MARTKRTECLWSQSLTGCVHYRWPRDWFVSLSKTRTHRRRPPPPSLPVVLPFLPPASSPSTFRAWCCPGATGVTTGDQRRPFSKVYFRVRRRGRTDHDDDPGRETSLSALISPIDNVEAPFHRYQLVRFAKLRPPRFRHAPDVLSSLRPSADGVCRPFADRRPDPASNARQSL